MLRDHHLLVNNHDLDIARELLTGAPQIIVQVRIAESCIESLPCIETQRCDRVRSSSGTTSREVDRVLAYSLKLPGVFDVLAEPDAPEVRITQLGPFPDEADSFDHLNALSRESHFLMR